MVQKTLVDVLAVFAGTIGFIFILAFLNESLTEYIFGTPFKKVPGLAPHSWVLQYITLITGVGIAFAYRLDLIGIFASAVGAESVAAPWVGYVLTGLIIGRGSEWLHKLVSKFFPAGLPRFGGA